MPDWIRPITLLILSCSLFVSPAAAQPRPGPSRPPAAASRPAVSLPATKSAIKPLTPQQRQRLKDLTIRSIELVKASKLDEAERTLAEAVLLNPRISVNLYNMACVKALNRKPHEAMDYLERAALAGFTDFVHIERDTDLNSLRELPRFKQFIGRKEQFQRKAAESVVDWLKAELGEGYIYEIDQRNKLIFATDTDSQTLEVLRKSLVMQAKSQWEMLFSHRPDHYISVVLASPKHFRQFIKSPGVHGIYDHDQRVLFAERLGQVMQHEFTHALHAADLDPLGQEHPLWLSEGLGTMFEAAFWDGDALVPADNFRLATLINTARRNALIPLDQLLKMDQKAFIENSKVTLTYGQAGSLLLYLYEQGKLRSFYDAVKANFAADPTGRSALQQVTGKSLAELEKDWKAWLLKRTPAALSVGPQGAYLGVRFDDDNDGLRVEFVVPGGPAERAGLKAEDVVVGLNQHDVRDRFTLLPLLGKQRPGDRITLKIRRGQEYLDILVVMGKRGDIQSRPATRPTTRPSPRPTPR